MSRYKVNSPWRARTFQPGAPHYIIQHADALDTRTGTVFESGAYRIIDATTGKPVRGKGGTHPFFGETAWSDADRMAVDLHLHEMFQR